MAQLFKDKVIKDKVTRFTIKEFDQKLAIINKWQTAYQEGKLKEKTESQCEQAFNQDFFIGVLDYASFPQNPYTIEPKSNVESKGGQTPDAVLGYFNDLTKVVAVCEIKDANTNLDRPQQRKNNETPVRQAFRYKSQYAGGSPFVIVTNFIEFRLYKDDELDYEKWTLADLVNPENNYYQFRKFYYLLCAENFVCKTDKSNTEQLLSTIRIQQEQITNKFYQEYKTLRLALIENIKKNNPKKSIDLIITKAQKIIDRIVFVCFCEDIDLLPDGKLLEVVQYAGQSFVNKWEVMKGFFKAIDSGSEKLQIPDGYNGELFKDDKELNSLVIDDQICQKFVDLSKFDFSEDLTVNILGHIFEQSISDLEELRANGTVDKKTSKRKKDGIFYTPEYIVDYIVQNSLGAYLREKEEEILTKHKLKAELKDDTYKKRAAQAYREYQNILHNVKVLDPACGSGAFLVKVFDFLFIENKRIVDLLSELEGSYGLFDDDHFIKEILQNNIFGVDLNSESVEITKLSLWLKTAKKGKKLCALDKNIKCGNSLIDDESVAGSKAFKWEKEFKEIMSSGGFDVVVGNPPYVRQEKINYKEQLINQYTTGTGVTDLYVYFYEKGVSLLNKKGFLGFITSNTFMRVGYGSHLRKYLSSNTHLINVFNFGDSQFFDGATTRTVIVILKKDTSIDKEVKYFELDTKGVISDFCSIIIEKPVTLNCSVFTDREWVFSSPEILSIKEKIKKNTISFGEYTKGKVFYGIKTGFNEAFVIDSNIKKELIGKDIKSQEIIKPFLAGKDINKWYYDKTDTYLIFTKRGIDIDKYPAIKSYLERFKIYLMPKKDTKEKVGRKPGTYQWYEIQDTIAYYQEFEKPKIIYANMAQDNRFVIDYDCYYTNQKAFIISMEDYYLLAILNSELIFYWVKNNFPRLLGNTYEFTFKNHMENVPIAKPTERQSEELSKISKIQTENAKTFCTKLNNFTQWIELELKPKKISEKIKACQKLTEDELMAELKKQGVKFKPDQLSIIKEELNKLHELSNKIESTDKEIDDMVFDLYGLSEQERKIVLES